MPKIFMVVNEDRFFLSHRLPVALAAREAGYDLTVVTKDTGMSHKIREKGFRVIDLPINPTGMNPKEEVRTFRFLLSLYRHEKPDIVHHVGLKNILWGGMAGKMAHIKGVINAFSGLGGLFNGDKLTPTTKSILRMMRFSNNKNRVRAIFQNHEDMEMLKGHKVVTDSQIYFTKGSGIDLEDYSFVEEPSTDKIRVIFTGRMVKEKGVEDLIEAAMMLRPEFEGRLKFMLCGRTTENKSGISEEELHEKCDGKYIEWLGERNDVKELLEGSHIMAFPSYYREGIPKSLIEAAAIGRPIVTCDSTGCHDVVSDGVNGFLVTPKSPDQIAKALRKLIENHDLRLDMGRKSREKAEQEFSIKDVVDTHIKIYNELSNHHN